MRLKKYASIVLIGLGIAIAIGFATVFATVLEPIFGGSATPGSGAIAVTPTCEYHAEAYEAVALDSLSQELETTGLIGRIHGAVPDANMAVLSVQDPNNFFARREFSLLANDPALQDTLTQLHRHDQICVQGQIMDNISPQPHVLTRFVEVLEPWTGLDDYPEYDYEDGVPEELLGQRSLVGKVHAIGAEGRILVLEYKDRVVPIFVKTPAQTADLYRGDIVQLAYQVQQRPQQPTHLQLDDSAQSPIEVLDAIASWHQQPATLSGHLVKFPQSPQIRLDVYALAVDTDGVTRTFTLVNFEDMETFSAIQEALAAIWDDHDATVVNGRNMLLNPEVTLQATGVVNVTSPRQANPQILLDTIDDLQLQTS